MWKFAMALALVMVAFLGSGGTAIFAAQASLPDDTLYPVKIWTEEIRLKWSNKDQDRLHLALEFTTRRMEEIRTMLQAGKVPPEPVITRTQQQLEYTLRLAMALPDDELIPALVMIQNRLQGQLQQMDQLNLAGTEPALLQIQNQIQSMLREQIRNLEQDRDCQHPDCQQNQTPPWVTGTPTSAPGYGPNESHNPWVTLTPTPGSGTGPGSNATSISQPTGIGAGTKPANTAQPNGTGSGQNAANTPQPHNNNPGTQSTPGSGQGGGGGNP